MRRDVIGPAAQGQRVGATPGVLQTTRPCLRVAGREGDGEHPRGLARVMINCAGQMISNTPRRMAKSWSAR